MTGIIGLEELRSRVQLQLDSDSDSDEASESDDEIEPLFFYDETDVQAAVSLLEDAKRILGFYGNKKLSGTIITKDRERMERIAEEIKSYLETLYAYEAE